MSDADEAQESELLIPFVVVQSRGGPWEDGAFTAGWRLGQLWQVLAPSGAGWRGMVREDDLPQVELIAMHYGCTVEKDEPFVGWVHVKIERFAG